MEDHVDRVLFDRATIAERVSELAAEIGRDFSVPDDPGRKGNVTGLPEHPDILLVPILTGSLIFLADLIRQLPLMTRIRLVSASSYPGKATRSQGVSMEGKLPDDLTGARVLVVDDILDSGRTLRAIHDGLGKRGPEMLKTCVLLRKQIPPAMAFPVDYVGFDIPDEFVVGYGLDYDGFYRNLPDVVTLRPEMYS